MVTFRFYIVSVVAFFLALAVGVVLGSALDGRISASLQNRLDRVENNLNSTVDLIDQKNAQIAQLNKYADSSVPFAVEGRLDGTATLVVAQSGVNTDVVTDTVAAIAAAGSHTPGVVWVDKSWNPKSAEFLARLDTVLTATPKPSADPEVERRVWAAVLDALTNSDDGAGPSSSVPPGGGTSDESPPSTDGSTGAATATTVLAPSSWWDQPLLKGLSEASVLRFQSLGQGSAETPAGLNVVAIMGADSQLDNDNSEIGALASVAADAGVPVVVADANSSSGSSSKNSKKVHEGALKALFERNQLSKVSSVQGLEEVAGQVGTVIALQQGAKAQYGNFGRGPMATSLLPPAPKNDGGS